MKLFVFLGILLPSSLFSQVSIQSITVENQTNPIGIGVSNPRFSWKLSSKEQVSKFLEYLYKNSNIYLERKFEIYKCAHIKPIELLER